MNAVELPANVPLFKLRFDFAIELGFLDHMRAPVTPQVLADYCRLVFKKPFAHGEAQKLNALTRQYPYKRFFLYCGLIAPQQTDCRPWIFDGRHWLPTEAEGLYRDMLDRAALAEGRPVGGRPEIFPLPLATPVDRWTYPTRVVLHDTHRALAGVVSYATAKAILEFNE
jgi:hypothetical protein